MDNNLAVKEISSIQMTKFNEFGHEIIREVGCVNNDDIAIQLTQRILDNLKVANDSLYQVCIDLKRVRDEKHYKFFNFKTFESYCEHEFCLTRRQVDKYISIATNISSVEFEKLTSQNNVGSEKFYILSRLTDDERTELLESIDIEHTPVREVQQKAREIKNNSEVQSIDTNEFEKLTSQNNLIIPEVNDTSINFKDFCKNVEYSGYRGCSLDFSDFTCFNGQTIKHDLLNYYAYFTRTINQLFKNDMDNLDYEVLSSQLSDLIEVSNRLRATLFDVKDSIKLEIDKKEKPYLYDDYLLFGEKMTDEE